MARSRKTQPEKRNFAKSPFVSVAAQGIASFADLILSPTLKTLDVSRNPIIDFRGLQERGKLTTIKADRTKIHSFRGAEALISLEGLSMLQTPIAGERHFEVMAVIVFGPTLKTINGAIVRPRVHEQANLLRSNVGPHLTAGSLLTCCSPPTVRNPETGATLIVDLTSEEYHAKKRQSEENSRKLAEMRQLLLKLEAEQAQEARLARSTAPAPIRQNLPVVDVSEPIVAVSIEEPLEAIRVEVPVERSLLETMDSVDNDDSDIEIDLLMPKIPLLSAGFSDDDDAFDIMPPARAPPPVEIVAHSESVDRELASIRALNLSGSDDSGIGDPDSEMLGISAIHPGRARLLHFSSDDLLDVDGGAAQE
jgi:hypothetical protein